eukprot:scaffold22704_cov97-Skeletonema_menzelii.AAC.1
MHTSRAERQKTLGRGPAIFSGDLSSLISALGPYPFISSCSDIMVSRTVVSKTSTASPSKMSEEEDLA